MKNKSKKTKTYVSYLSYIANSPVMLKRVVNGQPSLPCERLAQLKKTLFHHLIIFRPKYYSNILDVSCLNIVSSNNVLHTSTSILIVWNLSGSSKSAKRFSRYDYFLTSTKTNLSSFSQPPSILSLYYSYNLKLLAEQLTLTA